MRMLPIVCLLAMTPVALGATQSTAKTTPKATPKTASTQAKSATKGGRTVELTAGDTMKFDVTSIQAKPGERLHVVLKSNGTAPKVAMAHNFVLLKEGVSPVEFNNAAMNARDTDFVPPSMTDKIVAHTGLAGPGETVDVSFAAPTKPGTYTYLCSFPGHYQVGMKGELIVK
jgi:azurin